MRKLFTALSAILPSRSTLPLSNATLPDARAIALSNSESLFEIGHKDFTVQPLGTDFVAVINNDKVLRVLDKSEFDLSCKKLAAHLRMEPSDPFVVMATIIHCVKRSGSLEADTQRYITKFREASSGPAIITLEKTLSQKQQLLDSFPNYLSLDHGTITVTIADKDVQIKPIKSIDDHELIELLSCRKKITDFFDITISNELPDEIKEKFIEKCIARTGLKCLIGKLFWPEIVRNPDWYPIYIPDVSILPDCKLKSLLCNYFKLISDDKNNLHIYDYFKTHINIRDYQGKNDFIFLTKRGIGVSFYTDHGRLFNLLDCTECLNEQFARTDEARQLLSEINNLMKAYAPQLQILQDGLERLVEAYMPQIERYLSIIKDSNYYDRPSYLIRKREWRDTLEKPILTNIAGGYYDKYLPPPTMSGGESLYKGHG